MNTFGTHCTYCGAPHAQDAWPRTCPACQTTTWRNPTPVSVVLLPVAAPRGLVVIRRGIEPALGSLALPGGYVDWMEGWQQAGAREVREETGIVIDPAGIEPFDVRTGQEGRLVLIFGVARVVERAGLPEFNGTNETTERRIIEEPIEMAFPTHTEAVRAFFDA